MVCGVTVLYNPTEEVFENINSYLNGLNKLYLVDNSEKENKKLKDKFIKFSSKIEYIKMNGNEGIAKALNIVKNKAIEENYNWLLTMDQDSSFKNNDFINFVEKIKKFLSNKIAIFYPCYDLNNTIKLRKKICNIDIILTSGNILNLNLAKEIGDFDEKLFIDEVDHDYCYRIFQKNYQIKEIQDVFLKHKVGEMKKNIFCSITNHNKIRKYYIARNRCYMIKKYPFLKKVYIGFILKDIVKIILFEKEKFLKIKMIYLGIKDFKNNIMGKINQDYLK